LKLSFNIIFHQIIEFLLVGIIALSFYFTLTVTSKQVIYIPKGSTTSIINYLNLKKYDLNFIDKIAIRILGYPQNGWIDLKQLKMSKADFLYKLTTSKAALKSIILIPGETYYFFLNSVAKKLKLDSKKLFFYYDKYKYKKDGNILAQTYSLPLGMKEEEVILYLFKYTNKQYYLFANKIFGLYNQKNWFKYIAIASVIQKEAASISEMPIVSSVIYNRLKKNMKLQMDGTLNYGKFSHTKVTPQMLRQDTSIYNTYLYKGIPSSPICAVDFNSIKAAIFPIKTPYLYFMKAVNGKKHIFTSNLKGHNNAIKQVVNEKKALKNTQKSLYEFKKQDIEKNDEIINTKKESKADKSGLKSLWDNIN
jgi:UPF0755 protein